MSFGISRHLRSAVHHNSCLSARGLLERSFTFFFKKLVYKQIREDPLVDMKTLKLRSDSRLLTTASAGCNALNYLTALPQSITAVDFNRKQVYLTRPKIAALEHLCEACGSQGGSLWVEPVARRHAFIAGFQKDGKLRNALRNFCDRESMFDVQPVAAQ